MIRDVQTFHIVIGELNENGNDINIVPKLDAHNARPVNARARRRREAGDIVIPRRKRSTTLQR